MENVTIITGHKNPDTDSICSALSYAYVKTQLGEKVEACRAGNVNPETQYVLDYWKVDAPRLNTELAEGQDVILVDHNELSQAVDGFSKANPLEIIDHHRMGGIVTANPLMVRIQPVGCTGTIIYNISVEKNVTLTPTIAGLLFSAISSDTLYFKSPTTTEKDKEAAMALAKIAGLEDPQKYAMDMLQAGSAINSLSPSAICHGDMKEFDFPQGKVTVAQINVMDGEKAKAKWPALQGALQDMVDQCEADTTLLMVTDIINEVTELLWAGKNAEVLDKAFGQREADGHYHLPGVLSRKKQIVPPLTKAFQE
ncbi:MAG: manganese-dependent inorganic pyrophosphatase [Acidaminococcus provencensis]|jgi:manganese-dependent inorganic pyrophosphatase|uniref:manganese-dependent inorganic pyrophosphatase n=1 Tax=Acidaminococcus TaxID=904 RepID=UPI000CF8ACFA|nr:MULTISPECIES: manganese-dependent inorganic pyrophosphatase [Acidaminococcus]MCH4095054.1 manganese-dependent inorganic pyrophosphatase [Acidaminococcus provencensis]RHJ97403.1 manganese-dependent inorganic pyrophosphatase [Acidaminococcus sp. AM05-11]